MRSMLRVTNSSSAAELIVASYRAALTTDGSALNHLLRMHLFGDPTEPLSV